MAGTSYQIDIAAQMTGGDVTSAQLRDMADKLTGMGTAASSFDAAIDQTRAAIAAAESASATAATALAAQEIKYKQLEVAADRAAKAVEKASASGKDTGALAEAAERAKAALVGEAAALDKLRASAKAATDEEKKLVGALKNLESAAKSAEAAAKKPGPAVEDMTAMAKGALGPMGGIYEKATLMAKGIGKGGWMGAVILASVATIAFTAAVAGAVFELARLAVTLNKGAMEKLTKIQKTAQANFAKLFSRVHVDKFVAAIGEVSKMLDENSSTARGLSTILETILNPIFDASTGLTPIVKELFRGMVFGALQVAIAAIKAKRAVEGMIPDALKGKFDVLGSSFEMGAILIYAIAAAAAAMIAVGLVLAAVLGLITIAAAVLTALTAATLIVIFALVIVIFALFAVAIAVVVVAIGLLIAAILILAAIIFAPIIAIVLLIAYFDEVVAALGEFGSAALQAAGDLIQGLVNGITSGAGAVYEAIKGLAAGAIGTLKSALGIASPSTVFALQGSYTAQGYVEGVEAEQSSVDTALERMVTPPDAEGGAAGAATVSASSGGNSYIFNIYAPDGSAGGIASAVRDVLTDILEGDVAMLGGAAA